MKNLFYAGKLSVWIIALLLVTSCEVDQRDDVYVPGTLSHETLKPSLEIAEQDKSGPVLDPLDGSMDYSRYLTLFDEARRNAIVIKVSTPSRTLLESLNEETVELVALTKALPSGVDAEASKEQFNSRSSLIPVDIDVLETKIEKNIRYYGLKFVNIPLIKSGNMHSFAYRNHNVSAVHAIGNYTAKDIPLFTAVTADCPDCQQQYLAPKFNAASKTISFYQNKKADIVLKVSKRFTGDLMILW